MSILAELPYPPNSPRCPVNMWIKKGGIAFYLVAAKKATWVISSSTGAIRENSARVLALAGSAQTGTVWSGNTASICAASVSASMRRTSASLSWTNRTSLDGSSSTSTLGGNSFRPEASISLKKDGRESSLNWVMRPPQGVPHLSHWTHFAGRESVPSSG